MNAFFFELLRRPDSLPCACDLDQDALARNALRLVERDQLAALRMVPSVSKLRRGVTSVDTRPGTTFRISQPNRTKLWSMNSSAIAS